MFSLLAGALEAYPMWLVIACAGAAVLSYFLGCFNGSVMISKYVYHDDIRNYGSGNGGLTNFLRVYGGPWTGVVIFCDVAKAVISVLFAAWLFGKLDPGLVVFGKYLAGLCCLLGHMYPCTFQFRGGKGVLSGGFVAIMLDWRIALVVWGGFLLLAVLTKYVSLGSCWAGASFPFVTLLVYRDLLLFLIALVCGGLLLWKHRANIHRLLTGTESKFSIHKKAQPEPEKDEEP